MRRILALALPLTLLATAARAEKLGYVDLGRVVREVEEGKAATARLKAEAEAKRADLQKREAELKTMSEEYQKQQAVLSEDAKNAKQEEMKKKYMELQQLDRQAQAEVGQSQERLLGQIEQKLMPLIQEVAEKNGISFVLRKEVLAHAPPSADITNEVVREYNKRFGGSGEATAQAAPKKGKKKAAAAQKEEE
jgi:outer membrane protein